MGLHSRPLYIDNNDEVHPWVPLFFVTFIVTVGPKCTIIFVLVLNSFENCNLQLKNFETNRLLERIAVHFYAFIILELELHQDSRSLADSGCELARSVRGHCIHQMLYDSLIRQVGPCFKSSLR